MSGVFRAALRAQVCVAVLGGLLGALTAQALTTTVDAGARGWYREVDPSVGETVYTPGANGAAATSNYLAGQAGLLIYRNWFRFDLSAVSGSVTSATLLLDNPERVEPRDGFGSTSDLTETYTVFDVDPGNVGSLGTYSAVISADLGSGVSYASYTASAADNGTTVAIPLNAAGLSAVNAALGGDFAVGGAITTLNGVIDEEYVFAFTALTANATQLQLTIIPEPSTALLLGAGLLAIGVRRRRLCRPR